MPAQYPDTEIIEGSFVVVATRDLPPGRPRPSPNRRRLAARIVFWNLTIVSVVVGLPILF